MGRQPHGMTLLTLVVAATVGVFVVAITAGTSAAEEPRVVKLGAAVGDADPALVVEFETEIGRELDVIRVFKLWDDEFPTADDLALLEAHELVLSIKASTSDEVIAWADIAAAQPGDPLHDQMVSWAQQIAGFQDRVHLTFHHEPEAASNLENGTAADFVGAWRAFMTVLEDQQVTTLGRVWIMTDYSFHVPADDRRHADGWYPGDDWVEAIGADAYNWHDCRPDVSVDWTSLAVNIEPLRRFGLDHPDEELMLAELGSVEDPLDSERKAAWIDGAASLFLDPTYDQFTLVSWFNIDHPTPGTTCDWRTSTGDTSAEAFARLAAAPLFGGQGENPSPWCTAERDGTTVTVSWTDDGGTHVIRRNGRWLSTPGGDVSEYTDVLSPEQATYSVRTWVEGVTIERVCVSTEADGNGEPPAPWCTASRIGETVVLSWTDDGGLHVVRRDGRWLATPGRGTATYTDLQPGDAGEYTIRTWTPGGRLEHACEWA